MSEVSSLATQPAIAADCSVLMLEPLYRWKNLCRTRSAANRVKPCFPPSIPSLAAQANVGKQRLLQKQRAARKAADRGKPFYRP